MENQQQLIVEVSFEDIVLQVRPHQEYEWLLSSKEVAEGYGVTEKAIREHKRNHKDELIHNKHFIGAKNSGTVGQGGSLKTFWTKRGVIRLGFFIKSERAKLFRDWAEDLILNHLENQNAAYVTVEMMEKNNEFLRKMMMEIGNAVYTISNGKVDKIYHEITSIKKRLSALENSVYGQIIADKAPREAYVYVFHKVGSNKYKIGKSIDPLGRKKQLEQGGIKLELLLSMQFKSEALALVWENTLQRTFKSSHLQGEWYLLSKPELSFLLELAKAKEILD